MAAIPAWKIALIERKRKQEEEEKARLAQAEEVKLASLPAWKRAIVLREKQTKEGVYIKTAASAPSDDVAKITPKIKESTKWQEAVERVKGADSPILNKKSWDRTASPLGYKASPSLKQSSSSPSLNRNQVIHRWKHVNSNVDSKGISTNQPLHQTAHTTVVLKPSSCDEGDPNLEGLPAWKKELILKKRRMLQKQNQVAKPKGNSIGGNDETDSASIQLPNSGEKSSMLTAPSNSTKQADVVNRSKEELPTKRLVEQEGITLHPPVYKLVDQWANADEEDEKFKKLPLWKQALIKRRQADIANRSGQSATVKHIVPIAKDKETEPVWKKQQLAVTKPHSPENTKILASKSIKQQSIKTGSKASAPGSVKSKPISLSPVTKEEPMFTYNFSKSKHRLDTGESLSDSTDSDLEDAIVTNLDDSSSDEGDSGIVLQSYSTLNSSCNTGQNNYNKTKTSSTGMQYSKSAMVKSKEKKKHLRRVSWSDTHLVSEHFYPKYDYSDYDEIDQDNEETQNSFPENSGLSQRLHPSLRLTKDASSDPYHYGYSQTATLKNGGSSDNFLENSPHMSLSSYSPKILAGYPNLNLIEQNSSVEEDLSRETVHINPANEDQAKDFYADLTSNTAALLW